MHYSAFTLLLIALIALTACGGEPETVLMDSRYLTTEQLDQQASDLQAKATGEVLDTYTWVHATSVTGVTLHIALRTYRG